MEKKITIKAVREMFPVGAIWIGEFIGANRTVCKPGSVRAIRQVEAQSPKGMTSRVISNCELRGRSPELDWKGITATIDTDSNVVTLSMDGGTDPFLTMQLLCTPCASGALPLVVNVGSGKEHVIHYRRGDGTLDQTWHCKRYTVEGQDFLRIVLDDVYWVVSPGIAWRYAADAVWSAASMRCWPDSPENWAVLATLPNWADYLQTHFE